mmetsp:Transcript_31502/g.65934  ORF Transcript_31502/g.65934 Transcript_31502/m.65934 type:complete len:370 (-) Transcript_31502:1981-3090(-)
MRQMHPSSLLDQSQLSFLVSLPTRTRTRSILLIFSLLLLLDDIGPPSIQTPHCSLRQVHIHTHTPPPLPLLVKYRHRIGRHAEPPRAVNGIKPQSNGRNAMQSVVRRGEYFVNQTGGSVKTTRRSFGRRTAQVKIVAFVILPTVATREASSIGSIPKVQRIVTRCVHHVRHLHLDRLALHHAVDGGRFDLALVVHATVSRRQHGLRHRPAQQLLHSHRAHSKIVEMGSQPNALFENVLLLFALVLKHLGVAGWGVVALRVVVGVEQRVGLRSGEVDDVRRSIFQNGIERALPIRVHARHERNAILLIRSCKSKSVIALRAISLPPIPPFHQAILPRPLLPPHLPRLLLSLDLQPQEGHLQLPHVLQFLH